MDVDSLKAVSGNSNSKSDYSAVATQIMANKSKEMKVPEKIETHVADSTDSESKKGEMSVSKSKDGKHEEKETLTKKQVEELQRTIEVANEALKPINKAFLSRVHEATHEIVVTIKDTATGEIIKEIPSEETLDRIAKMRELAYGGRSSGGMVIDAKK